MPLVSIIMITYNREKCIVEAIESILRQSFQNWELLIVDDSSTDNTQRVVKKFVDKNNRIKYLKNETNLGIVTSRNKVLKLSQGIYIAVLDSDDVWHDDQKLEKQVLFLEEHKDYVLVGCKNIVVIDQNAKTMKTIVHPSDDDQIRKQFLYRNPFTHSSVLFRKEVVDVLGGYKDYQVGEDYDLFLGMGLKGKIKNLSDVSMSYRKHTSNISVQKRMKALKLNIHIIKKYKNEYPYYFFAYTRRYVRYIIGKMIFR